jgi:hypothetical protein
MAKSLEVLLTEEWIKPEEVLSPANRIKAVKKVLYNGGENSLSVAILDYVHDGGNRDSEAVGIRWNGSDFDTRGFPSVRQYPVWFIAPDELASTIKFMAEQNFQFRLPFDEENAAGFMKQFGNQFSTESLSEQLKARGFKVILEM